MIYTIDEISSRIRPVAEKYHLKAVYLFGSYARGEARDDSDVRSVDYITTWRQLCRRRSTSLQRWPLSSRAVG